MGETQRSLANVHCELIFAVIKSTYKTVILLLVPVLMTCWLLVRLDQQRLAVDLFRSMISTKRGLL